LHKPLTATIVVAASHAAIGILLVVLEESRVPELRSGLWAAPRDSNSVVSFAMLGK